MECKSAENSPVKKAHNCGTIVCKKAWDMIRTSVNGWNTRFPLVIKHIHVCPFCRLQYETQLYKYLAPTFIDIALELDNTTLVDKVVKFSKVNPFTLRLRGGFSFTAIAAKYKRSNCMRWANAHYELYAQS